MAKIKSVYVCTECGTSEPKWQGQCPACMAWNTLVESIAETANTNRYANKFESLAATGQLQKLSTVQAADVARQPTGITEFDRVLGGGLVEGGVILIGGDPGIGKSTLLLQVLCHLGKSSQAIYVSGEESPQQIAMRAKRLGLDASELDLLAEINLEKILATLQSNQPNIAVIDSIQTVYSEALQSAPGSVAQVRECSAQLTRLAKQLGITVILVGHVTKEGALAGPRVLEHIVDTVLYFEGDQNSTFRLIRAFKNRFGAVNEIGVFAMTEKGLREVANPSALFLSHHETQVAGSCITVTMEGTRPLLIEIQALVDESHTSAPKRLCVGVEQNRLAMLLAVLHRHAGVACFDQDVFINAVGGVKISEPAVDLSILIAISSSFK
ncbi:MAG: DNA repair protein RadA, partial [Methylophilaceae bacterium]|nr:DNA repair protein RadA [Methylophilaceae bacterium]